MWGKGEKMVNSTKDYWRVTGEKRWDVRSVSCFWIALPDISPLYWTSVKWGRGQIELRVVNGQWSSQLGFAVFSWMWLLCRHQLGRVGWWHITPLDLFSPQKGSQELLPKTESRGYVVRSQWSGTSRNTSRGPSTEEPRSKSANLKAEVWMKEWSTW